ncbi:MAG: hypothetical protein FJ405_03320 [Verrucomicrobia bacterium]|nr:hypothetical protein [Verrucomicrobiota bacterium]
MRNLRLALLLSVIWTTQLETAEPPAEKPRPASPPPLTGRWQWTFAMPDGTKIHPVASLRWDGRRLTGRTHFKGGGDAPIAKGSVAGLRISFQTARTSYSATATTKYAGVIDGGVIRGQVESNWNGEPQTYPWEAIRLEDTPEGVWKWTRTLDERKLDFTLRAKVEGDKVTGKVQIRPASEDISQGRFRDGQVKFELEGKVGGETFRSRFEGRVAGDQITGKEVFKLGKQERTFDWVAERAD